MRSNIVTLAILFAFLAAPLRGEVIESPPPLSRVLLTR
jgi:hypothetical protein